MAKTGAAIAAFLGLGLLLPQTAGAFCGFYIGGAETSLYNEATMVVMMRDGTRTVLSMQNDYRGPPEDFAMVVPVPVVLAEGDVRTLPREVFERVDRLAAPRLVEYWEQDPCPRSLRPGRGQGAGADIDSLLSMSLSGARQSSRDYGVTVEAEFAVAEYDVVILSAEDSSGLDRYLRDQRYNIPAGAGEVLRPYVAAGTKFFVAKVDSERVTFRNGRAVLSPLRFHYDSDTFSLPVRLGLLNSRGKQDLIVHILAPNQRYEVANYANVTIPTNLRVYDGVRRHFGQFYAALFDKTLERNPGAVVTEYAWNAATCDPCPTPPLRPQDVTLLGDDVLGNGAGRGNPSGFVLTRLHYRYDANDLGDDLVFRQAGPIVGGRGVPNRLGRMEEDTQPGQVDNFQGRYVILHRWEGAIACDDPQRGLWGGPPNGAPSSRVMAATNPGAVRRRPIPLQRMVRDPVPELGIGIESRRSSGGAHKPTTEKPLRGSDAEQVPPPTAAGVSSCSPAERTASGAGVLGALLAVFLLVVRRRR